MDRQTAPPTPQPRAPDSGARRFLRFRYLTQILNVAGTLLILTMALSVNFDVLGRVLFNRPIPGVNEFIGLSIVAVVFLQMANTLQEDRHVSNDIFIRLIAKSHPRLSAALYSAFHVIGAALMTIIVIYVWPIMVANYRGGYYSGTAGVVEIPIWPFMAIVVTGAAATAVQFVIDAYRLAVSAAGRGPA
ncbi:MAG: TRAP transporter small permease [Alphaproteobacteria bacterium]|nr:TRAP transporter small permease [Alphaproteobacteria bacterium]